MDQFQIQFQKERESLESFDLADFEKTSVLWRQYSHVFYHTITDLQKMNREKKGSYPS